MFRAIGRAISVILALLFFGSIFAVLGLMLVGSFWLDGAGIDNEARVASKQEIISFSYASWTRKLEIGLLRDGGPMAEVRQMMIRNHEPDAEKVGVEKVRVSSEIYDRYHVGQVVKVKVQPDGFFKKSTAFSQVRLAGQTTYSIAYSFYESAWPMPQFVLSLVPAALLGWFAHRTSKQLWWASGACALIVIVYWLTPFSDERPEGDLAQAEGKVVALKLIDEVWETEESGGFDALEPHFIVGVEFKPGGRNAVVAVDRVDASSVNLKEGSRVRVEYQRDDPRRALIAGASRSWWWWNIVSVAQWVVILGGLWIGWWLFVRYFKLLLRGVRAS